MLEKLKLSKDTIALALLGVVALATHLPWLFTLKPFTSGDWWYISAERYKDFLQFSPIWVTNNLGSTSATPHFYLIRFFEGALNVLGATFLLNEKLFFFVPIVFASAFGAYFLVRVYFSAPYAFLGAIVYSFNTILLFNHAGALTIGVVYALAPVAVLLFKKYLDNPASGRLLVANAFVFALMVAYELRISFLVGVIFFGLFMFQTLVRAGNKGGYFIVRLWPLGKLLLIVLLLHLFWILPFALSASGDASSIAELAGRGLFVSFSDILNGLTLHHPFWTGGRPSTFVPQAIPWYAWAIPLFAFAGFIIRRNNPAMQMYFWGIIALLGIFLVKQVNEPFATAYPWLYDHVPGFGAFRESSKFYIFVALSYAVLIPFGIKSLSDWFAEHSHWQKRSVLCISSGALYTAALAIFLINAWPLVTSTFRTLTIPREMPKDYVKLNNFINIQQDYFRTLWVPVNSRWAADTNAHPNVLATNISQGKWLGQLDDTPQIEKATIRDKVAALLDSPGTKDALSDASIKYVIVPLRDTESEDDFFRYYGDDRQYYIDRLNAVPYLKRLELGLTSIAVYENVQFSPHIATHTSLNAMAMTEPYEASYRFITEGLKDAFNFDASQKRLSFPARNVADIFQGGSEYNISAAETSPRMYVKEAKRLRYEIKQDKLTLYGQDNDELRVNGSKLNTNQPELVLGSADLQHIQHLYLKASEQITPIQREAGARTLGVVSDPFTVYAANEDNLISNGSFESGLWQTQVEDCNKYDDKPDIGMQHVDAAREGGLKALQFVVNRHKACTQTMFANPSSQPFMLSFDYRADGGDTVGYELHFNDVAHTIKRGELKASNNAWRSYQDIIVPPKDAANYTLRIFGYPDYRLRGYAVTQYDNFRATPLRTVITSPADTSPIFKTYDLPAAAPLRLTYGPAEEKQPPNLVPNGSFEEGLWTDKVGDCNAYDTNAILAMKLAVNQAGNASKALQLEARRHTACTQSQPIAVEENTNYTFSFDYQSPNAKRASYYFKFNDPAKTVYKGEVTVKGRNWQTFSRHIKAPYGATEAKIVVYAYSDEYEQLTIINRYDNISLRKAPDAAGQYYAVVAPKQQFMQPQSVNFEPQSATRKTVSVKGAFTSFYLTMSEAYHAGWRLVVNNQRAQGIGAWLPFAGVDAVNAAHHYKHNDFLNGWFVDIDDICKQRQLCQQNADGSYDIALIAEFSPHRWVYAGALVSGGTFVACVLYVAIASWRIRRFKRREELRKVDLHAGEPDGMHLAIRAAPPLRVPKRRPVRPLARSVRPKRRLIQ